MTEIQYGLDNYKTKFFCNDLETKKICKNAVKKLPFVIKFVPDPYKTQEIKKCVMKLFWKILER